MSFPADFDKYIALRLPVDLHARRDELQYDAMRRRPALKKAWPSLHLANWLNETAARAGKVQDIVDHLHKQRKRRTDDRALQELYEIIEEKIGNSLRNEVERAICNAAAEVLRALNLRDLPAYVPHEAWLRREHLAMTRLYIGALVNWRRIDMALETEREA